MSTTVARNLHVESRFNLRMLGGLLEERLKPGPMFEYQTRWTEIPSAASRGGRRRTFDTHSGSAHVPPVLVLSALELPTWCGKADLSGQV